MNNVAEVLSVLDPLSTSYGMMKAAGMLRIYDTEEAKNRAEPEHLTLRGQPKPAEEA